jgi:hypothetical protein
MNRWTLPTCVGLLLYACGSEEPETVAPPTQPPEPVPNQPPAQAAAAEGPNPCANPQPVTLELEAGIMKTTPWGLEVTYAIEEDKKRGPSYVFLLRSGTRRWEARRNDANWNAKTTWRGFCWRGGERPERKASKLQIQIAPVCQDGKLVEMGGCGTALGPE